MKTVVLCATVLALAGCNRGGIENKEAVRQGVIDYLAGRPNLTMASMAVDVTSVTFKGNEADATVSFAPKGSGGAAQGMTMRYTLERKGNRWVVKGRSGGANAHGSGMGAGGAMPGAANPHGSGMGAGGAMPEMPGAAGGQTPTPGDLPPGHPAVKGSPKK